jgi:UDP-N-acetylmuramoylalanine--D-glutamate ligase
MLQTGSSNEGNGQGVEHVDLSKLSVCVLGLGTTGLASARYLLGLPPKDWNDDDADRAASPDRDTIQEPLIVCPRVARLTIYAGKGTPNTRAEADALIEASGGFLKPQQIVFDEQEVGGIYDLAVISPGIAPSSRMYESAAANAAELIGEPELAWRQSPERWIGITGTNGKTTTTALLAHVLSGSGIKARAVGNIGIPCIDAIQTRDDDEYLVAELSSFQLATVYKLKPDAAILLNITPDHLGWHGSMENYIRDKRRIFYHMDDDAPTVIDATLETTRDLVRLRRSSGKRVIPLGTIEGLTGDMTERCGAPEAAFVDAASDMLVVMHDGRRTELLHADELKLKGEHNYENALAAAAVALCLGAEPECVRLALRSFEPLEHRIEPCGTVGEVAFYNDSKATNPEATVKALSAFPGSPLVLMLGGRDKNTDLTELIEAAKGTCKAVICYGEAGPRFYENFSALGYSKPLLIPDFNTAFSTAIKTARAGDIILLSPACASFDEFASFEARGGMFKSLVVALQASEGGR